MSKFNKVNKISNSVRHLARTVKKPEPSSTGLTEQDIERKLEALISGREKDHGVLRKSKYHKKIQSNMGKTIGKEMNG